MPHHNKLCIDTLCRFHHLIDRIAKENLAAYLKAMVAQQGHATLKTPLRLGTLFSAVRHVKHPRFKGKVCGRLGHHGHKVHPRTGQARYRVGVDQCPLC